MAVPPSAGEDGFVHEPHTLSAIISCLPREVKALGSRKQSVMYSCFDVSDQYLALGSEQGYVWIVDLYSTKLTREFNDFKGTAVTTLKLNIPHEYIVYGTRDGQIKIESLTKQLSKKFRIQEKERQTVVGLQWNAAGTQLYCAYASGKLIKVSIHFSRDQMDVSPLLECGSAVVQLSVCGCHLLISTLARSLLLDVESGRLTQVGTKERKPGCYGGSFSTASLEKGEPPRAYLTRPGLRVWTADESGKVVMTTKFKDPLSAGRLPQVSTHTWSTSSPRFADTWQLSLVLPWLHRFIVSYQEHTIWILDPSTSTVVGALYLEPSITYIATHGKFIYVLCSGTARPLARFTAPLSYLKSLKESKENAEEVEGEGKEGGGEEGGGEKGRGEEEGDHPEGEKVHVKVKAATAIAVSGLVDQESAKKMDEEEVEEEEKLEQTLMQGTGSSLMHPDKSERENCTEPLTSPTSHSTAADEKDTPHLSDITENLATTAQYNPSQVDSEVPAALPTDSARPHPSNTDPAPATVQRESEEGSGVQWSEVEESSPVSPSMSPVRHALVSIRQTSLEEAVETASTSIPAPNQLSSHDPTASSPSTPPSPAPSPTLPSADIDVRSSNHSARLAPEPISDSRKSHVPGLHLAGVRSEFGREAVVDLLRPTLGKLSSLLKHHERRKEDPGEQNPSNTSPQEQSPVEAGGEGGGGREGGGGSTRDTQQPVETSPSPSLAAKFGGKLSGLIAGDRDKEKESPSSTSPFTKALGVAAAPVQTEEKERRLRMVQATTKEDSISERLVHKKKRKKKTKKSSSKPSSTSASLERLTDIGDGEDYTPSSPYSEHAGSPAPEPTTETIKDQAQADDKLLQLCMELPSKLVALLEREEDSLPTPALEHQATRESAQAEKKGSPSVATIHSPMSSEAKDFLPSPPLGSPFESSDGPHDHSDTVQPKIEDSSEFIEKHSTQQGLDEPTSPKLGRSAHPSKLEDSAHNMWEEGDHTAVGLTQHDMEKEAGHTSHDALDSHLRDSLPVDVYAEDLLRITTPPENQTPTNLPASACPVVDDRSHSVVEETALTGAGTTAPVTVEDPARTMLDVGEFPDTNGTKLSSPEREREDQGGRGVREISSDNPNLSESNEVTYPPENEWKKSSFSMENVPQGKDPLFNPTDAGESVLRRSKEPHHSPSPSTPAASLSFSPLRLARQHEKTGSSEESHHTEEIPSELSDNPLYGDDTSDFMTDTDSSQQLGKQRPRARPGDFTRMSAPPSSSFVTKRVNSKSAPSVGTSQASSDFSLENSGSHVRLKKRSSRPLFEDSDSPVDFTHSLQPPSLDDSQQHPLSKATSLPPQTNVLPFLKRRLSREDSGSDISSEDNEPCFGTEKFKLCTPVEDSHPKSLEPQGASNASGNTLSQPDSAQDYYEEEDQSESLPEADIWVTVPHPCRGHIQSICISDQLLWLIDTRNTVYCTSINSKGRKWESIKRPMQQVTSSPSGHTVWGLYRQNAYVRLGLKGSVTGDSWKNITKTTSLVQKIRYLCADEVGVWAVKADGQIIFRKGVSQSLPQGRVWVEVGRAAGFTLVTACSGVVWAINNSGRLFYRDGVTEHNPSGRKWVDMKAPRILMACLTQNGIAWIIDQEGKMGFRCGIKQSTPTGKNPWWEITVSTTLHHNSLQLHSLWQVMTSEGSQLLSSVSSLITTHLPGHHKLLTVAASYKAGVCVLETGNKVHACWRSTTGYHYSPACKDGVFQLTTWTMFGIGGTGMWVIRDDGELYCITAKEKLVRIECASTVQMMSVSPTTLWVAANNQLWSRQGMLQDVPEGISWDYIELSPQLQERKLKGVVCGKRAVWAIDGTGIPHFRFGIHAREPGTGMSPAWVPVEDLSQPLLQMTVSSEDWLVWACDESFNVYARTGVTQDFPVGTAWEKVPGQQLKQLCASCSNIYGLTTLGNLYCRYGISESNVVGNYWRQMPGRFESIAVSSSGQLWALDSKGAILKQLMKSIRVCESSEFLRHKFEDAGAVLDQSWEVV